MAEKIKVVMMDIGSIIPYDNNPRKNSNAVDAVAKSIAEFGFLKPIIVDKDNVIICGHTRRLAALKLGLKEVPVQVEADMSEDQVKAFRLADNRIAELATWDDELLKKEIAEITGVDLAEYGFHTAMLQEAFEQDIGLKMHRCPKCGCEWRS